MHQNTTPELRVNKLGHAVTKHVKPTASISNPLPNVPAPFIAVQSREECADRIVEAVGGSMMFDRFSESPLPPDGLKTKLLRFSDSTLNATDNAVAWSKQLDIPIHMELFVILKERSERHIREFMVCRPQMGSDGMDASGDNFRAVQGLHNISHFKDHADLSSLDAHGLNVAGAFLRVTAALDLHDLDSVDYENDDHSINIHDKDLQDLIVAHPDKTDEITAFIAERKTGNGALIRAYIENGTALREGTL